MNNECDKDEKNINRSKKDTIDSWCWLNKTPDMTSMQTLAKLKYKLSRALNISHKHLKIGHAGTLDPFATGVLPIAIGQASKFIHLFLDISKKYKFTVKFGEQTDTDDNTGKVINTNNIIPSKDQVEQIINKFIGNIQQVPPRYSAILINGVRAYKTARKESRENITESSLKLEAREVAIYSLELLSYDENNSSASFSVHCGKGMYVRSLASDIAQALGALGHVTELIRTAYGPIQLEDTITLDEINNNAEVMSQLKPMESIIGFFPSIALDDESTFALLNGISVTKNLSSDKQEKYLEHKNYIGFNDKKIIGLINIKYIEEDVIIIYPKRMLANV